MISLIAGILDTLFSCKSFAKRTSMSLDRPLSKSDEVKRTIHYYICQRCRVAETHLRHIERESKSILQSAEDTVDEPRLSEDFKGRLSERLFRARNEINP